MVLSYLMGGQQDEMLLSHTEDLLLYLLKFMAVFIVASSEAGMDPKCFGGYIM